MKIHRNFIHALNASMFKWMALGIGSLFATDIALKVCLNQNSKPPKPTIDVSHLYMDVIFSPLLAYTLSRNCQTKGWAISLQRPGWTTAYEKLWIHVTHRRRQSCADQSLSGMNRCALDFRNRTRNLKLNLAKKRQSCVAEGAGSYSVPFYITVRMRVRDSLASWKTSGGFRRKCGRRGKTFTSVHCHLGSAGGFCM